MIDRMAMTLELTALSKRFAQDGDDRTAKLLDDSARLMIEDGAKVALLEQRRTKDTARKREKRKVSPRNPRNPKTASAESADTPNGFPGPLPLPQKTQRTGAREEQLQQQAAEAWPDIETFLSRRDPLTREGWAGSMLTCLTAMGATPADLAQVCRDDLALERRVASPKGLRVFVASAIEERRYGRQASNSKPDYGQTVANARAGDEAAVRAYNAVRAMIEEMHVPGQGIKRVIRSARVKELGKVVWEAYLAVGAERMVAVDLTGFTLRDFTKAFHANSANGRPT